MYAEAIGKVKSDLVLFKPMHDINSENLKEREIEYVHKRFSTCKYKETQHQQNGRHKLEMKWSKEKR